LKEKIIFSINFKYEKFFQRGFLFVDCQRSFCSFKERQ